MSEHGNHPCATCGRPVGCPECGRPWPDGGTPGYYTPDLGWRSTGRPDQRHADPRLAAADAALAAAQSNYDTARAAWEAATSARTSAQLRTSAGPIVVTPNGLDHSTRPQDAQKVARLAEIEAEAREAMDAAGQRVVEARQAHAAAVARAHRDVAADTNGHR